MNAIMNLAHKHGILVIEDCAQSYLAYYHGRLAGSIGDFGCFSLNDYKHISTGDGGMVIMNDQKHYERALRFADKNYNRLATDPALVRKIEFIAPNYRMNELTGAVAIAQLDRLEGICSARHKIGESITAGITDLPGIYYPEIKEGNRSSYWFYMLRINENDARVSRDEFTKALSAEGIGNSPGYIPSCVYQYELFQNKTAFEGTHAPFDSHTMDVISSILTDYVRWQRRF